MTDQRFELCLPYILREEGGNDDDPHDHGGRTSRGIIQREYDKWRTAHGQATQDVWTASTQEVHDIYYEEYWLPRCPKLRPGVDLSYFNICVNAGPGRAEKILHESIGGTDAQTVDRFNDYVVAFYRGLPQFSRYGKGWLARSGRIYAAARKMVQLGSVTPAVPPPVTKETPMGDTLKEVEAALQASQGILPMVLGILTTFIPGLGPLMKFLPLIQTLLDGVHKVQEATGSSTLGAIAHVADHLTPGAPNSPVLSRDSVSTG